MYASGCRSIGSAGPFNYRIGQKRVKPRNKETKKDGGADRCRYPFLKRQFHNISTAVAVRDGHTMNCNYITTANYLYLLNCARRYAALLGVKFNPRPADNPGAGIANLYHALKKIVGDEVHINFQVNEKRLEFVLWSYYEWGDYGLYFLPVKFVEKLPVPLRRLTISFLHRFHEATRIDTTNHNDDLDMIFDWQAETLEEYPEEERENAEANLLSYQSGGRIYKLMNRIEKRCYHKNLRESLEEYQPADDYQRTLVGLMKEGLKIIDRSPQNIFNYAYDQYDGEINDDFPVRLDQRFLFIYKYDDITESYVETLNEQVGNNYEILPCTTLTLSPDMSHTLSFDEYPQVFFAYMDKLKEFLDKKYHGIQ